MPKSWHWLRLLHRSTVDRHAQGLVKPYTKSPLKLRYIEPINGSMTQRERWNIANVARLGRNTWTLRGVPYRNDLFIANRKQNGMQTILYTTIRSYFSPSQQRWDFKLSMSRVVRQVTVQLALQQLHCRYVSPFHRSQRALGKVEV